MTILVSISLTAQTVEVAPATPAASALRSLVLPDASSERVAINNFYAPAGFRLVWTRGGQPTAQAMAVLGQFAAADVKGLRAADYIAARTPAGRDDASLARFDYVMTATLVRYANDLRSGRVAQSLDPTFDFPELVTRASSGDALTALTAAEPQQAEYRALLAALATYRRIAPADTETLPVVTKLAVGGTYAGLPQLAAKLRLYGDLAASTQVDAAQYDGAIVDAVKHFQSRHGLDADGVIARNTFAQLNVPASKRVQQIEVALERARTTPVVTDGPSIVVNIPEFKLHARTGNAADSELTMRVVVGKAAGHKTPIFEGGLKHVVFRPYWNVPPSIEKGEIAPKLDSAYAAKHHYEVIDDAGRVQSVDADAVSKVRRGVYHVRQKPGTANALGLVKFLFPNDNNVYLHSTPQQSFFSRARRDFSHGCVRVEDPAALAEWVLREKPEWTREKIEAAISGKRDDLYVNLAKPIDVKLIYQTVVAQPNGDIQFFDDIYGHDAKLIAQLTPAKSQQGGVLVAAR
ncbi:MAG: L,D-transpeptidase family protein [Acidobacteriota bacterium]